MPATATVADWRSGAITPGHSGRGHSPLLPSMIHPNGPWLGEGRQAVPIIRNRAHARSRRRSFGHLRRCWN